MDPLTAWAETPLNRPVAPGVYRDRKGWRTVINACIDIPGIGTAQRHVLRYWPVETPLEEMKRWRLESKAAVEAELQARLAADARELEKFRTARREAARDPTADPTTREQLREALRTIADQRATIRKLNDELAVAARRVELAEESARRAYRGFAASGARR